MSFNRDLLSTTRHIIKTILFNWLEWKNVLIKKNQSFVIKYFMMDYLVIKVRTLIEIILLR